MSTITLVCSIHHANGNCNVEQLTRILCAIEPDIIFQEVLPTHDWSLEAQAVTAYRRFKLCQTVHVDHYEPSPDAVEMKRLLDLGFEYVFETSEEYRLLERKNDYRIHHDGFSYLNSNEFVIARLRMSAIEVESIGGKAADALRWWHQIMQRREFEMMLNIYGHSRANAFDIGVFLVGASHKVGLTKQIEIFTSKEPSCIHWKLYDGQLSLE